MSHYTGPCIDCGRKYTPGTFCQRRCRTCYKRHLRGSTQRYVGPCIDCGLPYNKRFARQRCRNCYERWHVQGKSRTRCPECNLRFCPVGASRCVCCQRHPLPTNAKPSGGMVRLDFAGTVLECPVVKGPYVLDDEPVIDVLSSRGVLCGVPVSSVQRVA